MLDNQTSQAISNLLDNINDPMHEDRIDKDTVAVSLRELKGVAKKYLRMEEALRDISAVSMAGDGDKWILNHSVKALAFDPLDSHAR